MSVCVSMSVYVCICALDHDRAWNAVSFNRGKKDGEIAFAQSQFYFDFHAFHTRSLIECTAIARFI